ncbi:MAG: sigma 54-interacting transcriptional regulator [Acidobacteriales bacterium]|nr:sigma 54-interacting transcriptional regulator [Terriglobales bacterium]
MKELEVTTGEESPVNSNHVFIGGESPAMQALERVIADIARTNIPVLLTGESGTGKEIVAVHIHRQSQRAAEPFVKVVCATVMPEDLHAKQNESGRGVGTLLLDEISELDPACQAKLLHVLPDDRAEPGSGARIISSARKNLDEEIHAGRFREELYYRVNGVCLRLPPLRQRREDVPAMAEYFLRKYSALFSRPRPRLTAHTLQILQDHSWPGNVRELENAMRKLVALGDEGIALADLANINGHTEQPGGNGGLSLKEAARAASRQAERELILKVLGRTRWNRKRAAQELRISYKALLYKLKQIGLEDSVAYQITSGESK